MSKRTESPPLFQATKNLPGCGIRKGDIIEVRPNSWRIVRPGYGDPMRLVPHADALQPVGGSPDLHALFSIPRTPRRSRATLQLVK